MHTFDIEITAFLALNFCPLSPKMPPLESGFCLSACVCVCVGFFYSPEIILVPDATVRRKEWFIVHCSWKKKCAPWCFSWSETKPTKSQVDFKHSVFDYIFRNLSIASDDELKLWFGFCNISLHMANGISSEIIFYPFVLFLAFEFI